MKNPNEYREDGKLFIKEIKSCVCLKKTGSRYELSCTIHQRGTNEYDFIPEEKKLAKWGRSPGFYLAEEAEKAALSAVAAYEEKISGIKERAARIITMEDAGVTVYCEKTSGKSDYVVAYKNWSSSEPVAVIFEGIDLRKILDELQFFYGLRASESKTLLESPTKENIMRHPFILAAEKEGDTETISRVKLFYHLADKHDIARLMKLTDERYLCPLPEEYDKKYFIRVSTITKKDWSLLMRSGVTILHRPYFAMKDSTHSIITLNPHTMTGVDAAANDADAISFSDFLALFDA